MEFKYSYEEKIEAVLRIINDGMSVRESARILGASPANVRMWKELYLKKGPDSLKYKRMTYDCAFKTAVVEYMYQYKLTIPERITLLGEVEVDNIPLFAALELNFNNDKDIKVVSAYTRRNTKNTILNSKILWIEPNKNKTNNWLKSKGLQLPVEINHYDLINKISQLKDKVNQKEYFSIKEDTNGNKLTEKQQEYFKDSKIRDEKGRLQVMYHGTPNEFTVFDKKKSKSSNLYGSLNEPPNGASFNQKHLILNCMT